MPSAAFPILQAMWLGQGDGALGKEQASEGPERPELQEYKIASASYRVIDLVLGEIGTHI